MSEIWICGDIDQVECSRGEHFSLREGGGGLASVERRRSFSSSTQQAAGYMYVFSPLDNSEQHEFF